VFYFTFLLNASVRSNDKGNPVKVRVWITSLIHYSKRGASLRNGGPRDLVNVLMEDGIKRSIELHRGFNVNSCRVNFFHCMSILAPTYN
jgi:hypothetical protein